MIVTTLLALLPMQAELPSAPAPERYNVVWTTPSADSSGSMPLGNGDLAANAWVEPSGDLVFYLAKSDAWSENTRLLKLGRVRVALDPPLPTGEGFQQTLDLPTGTLRVASGDGDEAVELHLWIDAHRPVVRVEVASARPRRLTADLELWRTAPRQLHGRELFSAYGFDGSPEPVIVQPDTVADHPTAVVWYHRNETSRWSDTLRHQGLTPLLDELTDPLLHRTFGGLMRAGGLVKVSPSRLRSEQPRRRQDLAIVCLTAQTDTADGYAAQLERLAEQALATGVADAKTQHEAWWREFWSRSWIHVDSGEAPAPIGPPGLTTTPVPLRLGADSEGQNRFFGTLGRARLFNRALSPEEVAHLAADRAATPLEADGLVGDWDLSTLADGVVVNAAGDGLTARTVGEVAAAATGVHLSGDGWLEVNPDPALDLTQVVTLEAWIRPDRLPESGMRLLDKSLVGTSDGYLLDTWPGNSLRLITKAETVRADAGLEPGRWAHVAGTFDRRSGRLRLYVNGRVLLDEGVGGRRQDEPIGQVISQGYALQRYLNACAGRGAYPIKFNGSLFTVDPREADEVFDADYRRWGAPYWFQNTRLPYWSMLAAGDLDLMQPLFDMYVRALPLAEARTRLYHGHGGAFFPETMYFWGAYANENYGWNRDGKPIGEIDNPYIRWYYDGALELLTLALERHRLNPDPTFASDTLLPLARPILAFYDEHYPREPDGTLRLEPSQALETYQRAINPLPPIAGLQTVLSRLLALPDALVGGDRARWQALLNDLPPLPVGEADGVPVLLPAQQVLEAPGNIENPELYAVFPYRLVAVGRGNEILGRETYARRRHTFMGGWQQHGIQAAYLGLADEAARQVAHNFSTSHPGSRFPAFWGPNYDWIPDQDHGTVAMTGLQAMLLQGDESRIYLLPAWPAAWDVSFKLHGSDGTTVTARCVNGQAEVLDVTPPARREALVVMGPVPAEVQP